MDVLKDKSTKDYNHLSRYSVFPYYYNTTDKKYIYGITSWLNDSVDYVECKIKQGDTLDSLSEYYYGRPDFFWVIADYNRILDCFTELFNKFETIKIPNINSITFKR